MFRRVVSAVLVALVAPSSVLAQDLRGEIALGYGESDGFLKLEGRVYSGSVEYRFPDSPFSVQLDMTEARVPDAGWVFRNTTLHAILHPQDNVSLGLALGEDSLQAMSGRTIGVEATGRFGGFTVEGFTGGGTYGNAFASVEGRLSGVKVTYAATGQLDIGLRAERGGIAGLINGSKIAAVAEYRIDPAFGLFAEAGRVDLDLLPRPQDYVGFGIRIGFGPGAPTFDRRGLYRAFPGF